MVGHRNKSAYKHFRAEVCVSCNKYISRLSQGCLNVIADSLSCRDKTIQTEWALHPKVLHGRHVCNQNEQQTTSLCIFSPRSKCNGGRCIEYLVGGTRWLCLLSNSSHPKVDTKNENLSMQNDISSPRVARDELVLGSDRSIHKNTIATTSLGKPSQVTIQSKVTPKSTISQSSCLASGFETKLPLKFSESVVERIKAPQRPTFSLLNSRFFYLSVQSENLKPTTIAGYRAAIADHLGSSGVEISQSF